MQHALYLSLGSNLGDREKNLNDALHILTERIGTLSACSAFYETRPWGFSSPNLFLNAAALFATQKGDPDELLAVLQDIERGLGRRRDGSAKGYADRTIDIDILLLDGKVCAKDTLTLPHPRLHLRRFVLEPLCEIAPSLAHPTLNLTMSQLLKRLNQGHIALVKEFSPDTLTAVNRLIPQLSPETMPLTESSFKAVLGNSQSRLFALYDEEANLCAMATLCLALSPTGLKAWVEDVVVDKACRGRGYAKQLLLHLEKEARLLHAKTVNLTSRPERTAANRLYAALGYEVRKTNVYRKRLND